MINSNDNFYEINSFETIGWSDPFPEDEYLVVGSKRDHEGLK